MIHGNYINEKKQIESEIERLKSKVQELQKRHRGPALKSIIAAMREYDITPEDIAAELGTTLKPGRRAGKTVTPPKYRDNATGRTWTGRGRTPKWILEHEANGGNREDFAIN